MQNYARLSELRTQLEAFYKTYGDIPVCIVNDELDELVCTEPRFKINTLSPCMENPPEGKLF